MEQVEAETTSRFLSGLLMTSGSILRECRKRTRARGGRGQGAGQH